MTTTTPAPVRPPQPGVKAQPSVPQTGTALVRLRVNAGDDGRRALSPREVEVLTLVASGGTRDGISQQLGLSPGTVAKHMVRIYRALGARNASHAVALAYGSGIMAAPSAEAAPSNPGAPAAPSVSRRERQVLAGLALGLTSTQMAAGLSLSHETVKTHLQRVYRKLGAGCRAGAVDSAIRGRVLMIVVEAGGTPSRRSALRVAA